MRRRFAAALLALAALAGTAAPTARADFVDVPGYHWAYAYVRECVDQGILSGVGGDRYEPERSLTLAELLSILARCCYTQELAALQTALQSEGKDVEWYTAACVLAQEKGLTNGAGCQIALDQCVAAIRAGGKPGDGVFQPVTRLDMALILSWVLEDQGVPRPTGEELEGVWSANPGLREETGEHAQRVAWNYYYTILHGVDGEGTFRPDLPTDRASTAVICCRLGEIVRLYGGKASQEEPTTP